MYGYRHKTQYQVVSCNGLNWLLHYFQTWINAFQVDDSVRYVQTRFLEMHGKILLAAHLTQGQYGRGGIRGTDSLLLLIDLSTIGDNHCQ